MRLNSFTSSSYRKTTTVPHWLLLAVLPSQRMIEERTIQEALKVDSQPAAWKPLPIFFPPSPVRPHPRWGTVHHIDQSAA
jgi:hypothetical protein